MSNFAVRPMAPSHAADAAVLAGQLGYPSSAPDIERRLGALARSGDGAAFVVQAVDGKIIGWIQVYRVHPLVEEAGAEIGGLIVDEVARGRGVGRSLIAAAESWALEHGSTELRVRSNTRRTVARPFYEAMGYDLVKTQYVFRKTLR